MKVLAWAVNLVGFGLLAFGLFGLSETDEELRRETRLQGSIIDHYRSGNGAELRARAENDLERHHNARHPHSHSVVVNVFSIFGGMGLVLISGHGVYIRGKRPKHARPIGSLYQYFVGEFHQD